MTPTLTTPAATNVLPAIDAQVFLGGVRRTDCYAASSNAQSAQIVFPGIDFDSGLVLENTLVEIKVPPYGLIFRGYITKRSARGIGGATYTALDYLSKMSDQHFLQNYRYIDKVDGSTIKFNFTVRQIATIAYDRYLDWQSSTTPNDFLLGIDLPSFPSVFPDLGTASIRGTNLLDGLLRLLRQVDFRYSIRVTHSESTSVVSAYILGSGDKRKIVRGTDFESSATAQPHGTANVMAVTKDVDSANTVSHVYAEGDNHKIESSFTLTPNYPTATAAILNNLEKYTNEESASYLQVNERIGRYFTLPTIVDHGDLTAQVLIESNLVQTWQGNTMKPFIVYQKVGDAAFYAKHDGFNIVGNREVVFDEPFVDRLDHVQWQDTEGINSIVYDSGDNTSDVEVDFDILSDSPLGGGTWEDLIPDGAGIFIGEKMAYYNITDFDIEPTVLTVQGNLEDYSGEKLIILSAEFVAYQATNGLGATNGRYQIAAAGQDSSFTDEYAGFYLVVGAKDAQNNWEDPVDSLQTYRIRANTEKYLYLDTTETVVGASTEFKIMNPRFDTKQEFSFIALNAAYRSSEKLQSTVAAPTVLANKRIIYKSNTNFIWSTQVANYQLAGDGNTATAHAGPSDTTKDIAALEVWAAYQLAGINSYEIIYAMELPTFQVDICIGDQLVDNEFDAGVTVTDRAINYRTGVVSVAARSF